MRTQDLSNTTMKRIQDAAMTIKTTKQVAKKKQVGGVPTNEETV